MAFWGNEFIFDDVTCTDFGLMIYHFGSEGQDDVSFKNGEVVEDRLSSRYDSLMYGLLQNDSLEYTLVFGANIDSLDKQSFIDRYEVEAIAAWLTGHDTRKWLTIIQDDMEAFRYKCVISELKLITYGDLPWAFSCKVSCDSPFAYTFPEETTYVVSGEKKVRFFNRSSYNGLYRPNLEIEVTGGDSFSIENLSDKNRIFQFSGLPAGDPLIIYVDNKNQIITNNQGINLYPYFNMKFFRMVRGDNVLKITGDVKVKIICEFPVNIGG